MDQRLALTGLAAAAIDPVDLPGGAASIQAVAPIQNPFAATSAGVAPAAPAFLLNLNHAINLVTLGNDDFQVDQVNPDGSTIDMPGYDTSYVESPGASALVSNRLTVAFCSPLDPGTYRLVLKGTSDLNNLLDDSGKQTDQVVEEFAIGAAAAGAIPTQNPGPITGAVTALTFPVVADDLAHPLNELDLPAGTNWSIAPEFGTRSPDDFRVALFDSTKQLILSTTGSQLSALNQGLSAGRYYLQFYRTTPPLTAQDQSIVVTINGTPAIAAAPRVLAIRPLNENNLDPNADSILVQFDAATINPTALTSPHSVYTLEAASGQIRSLEPIGFDPIRHQLLLALPGALPSGHYALLASLPSAVGNPTSLPLNLGSFATTAQAVAADDLGTILTDAAGASTLDLNPGQVLTRRFSAIETRNYAITLSNPNLTVQLIREATSADPTATAVLVAQAVNRTFFLQPGIYRIVIENPTTSDQQGTVQVVASDQAFDMLQFGGVGQLPATSDSTSLVGSLSSTELSRNLTAPATSSGGAGDLGGKPATTQEAAAGESLKFEPSGTFGVDSLIQLPLGARLDSSSPPNAATGTSPSGRSIAGIATNAAARINSTTIGGPLLANLLPARGATEWLGPAETRILQGVARTDGLLSPDDRVDPRSPVVAMPLPDTAPSPPTRQSPVLETTATAAPAPTVVADSISITQQLDSLRPREEPNSEAQIRLAEMTSPLGVLVASCVIYRRIKAARAGTRFGGGRFGVVRLQVGD